MKLIIVLPSRGRVARKTEWGSRKGVPAKVILNNLASRQTTVSKQTIYKLVWNCALVSTRCPQLKSWQNFSALQALWNCMVLSFFDREFIDRELHQVGAKAEKELALVKDSWMSFVLGSTSRWFSVELHYRADS